MTLSDAMIPACGIPDNPAGMAEIDLYDTANVLAIVKPALEAGDSALADRPTGVPGDLRVANAGQCEYTASLYSALMAKLADPDFWWERELLRRALILCRDSLTKK